MAHGAVEVFNGTDGVVHFLLDHAVSQNNDLRQCLLFFWFFLDDGFDIDAAIGQRLEHGGAKELIRKNDN